MNDQPTPVVSVVMPTYNRGPLIARALDSVLAQTFQDWELVIVNDASTDATQTVIDEYVRRDPRIRSIIHERNQGVMGALNTGVAAVRGEFTARLDDDDEMFPIALERCVAKLQQLGPDYGMVFGNDIDPLTQQLTGQGFPEEREISYADAICERFKGDFFGMWRSRLMDGLRFDPRAYAGERIVWHQVYRRTLGWYIPDVLLKYNRGTATTNAITSVQFDDRPRWAGKAFTGRMYIEEFGRDLQQICPATLARHYSVLALNEVVAGQRVAGGRAVLAALRYEPSVLHVGLLALPFLPRFVLRQLVSWVNGRRL